MGTVKVAIEEQLLPTPFPNLPPRRSKFCVARRSREGRRRAGEKRERALLLPLKKGGTMALDCGTTEGMKGENSIKEKLSTPESVALVRE